MLKTVMIDDEEKARESFKWLAHDSLPEIDLVAQAADIIEGKKIIEEHKPDVVFLDIQLDDDTGFDLLETLDYTGFDLVFMTAYDQYAVNAFKVSAIDFLLKPVGLDEIKKAIKKIAERRNNIELVDRIRILIDNKGSGDKQRQKIVLPIPNGFHSVYVDDIVKCISSSNYTTFYYRSGKSELVSRTLKEFEILLEPFGFMRVHRSALVNLNCVTRFTRANGGVVDLVDGSSLEVARSKKEDFIKAFLGSNDMLVE